MHIRKIPKKNGTYRTIYVPNSKEKTQLRKLLGDLQKKSEKLCPEGVAHGFMRRKSPVTNAMAHIGHAYTLNFDLKDFFDTVTPERLGNKLSEEERKLVFVDGAARQGLPTSPSVANIAASELDKTIIKWGEKQKSQFVYTRYADDLTFSYDDWQLTEPLQEHIPKIVSRLGFKVNKEKTHLYDSIAGRRIVTGIAVGDTDIKPTREVRRRLRAAIHQKAEAQARGLSEWMLLKAPKERSRHAREYGNEIEALCKFWNLPKLRVDKLPDKGEDIWLTDDILITGDPVYMLGMSDWTTGWKSCMSAGGLYKKGVLFWCYLKGTKIAAKLSKETMIIGGVERRKMIIRCLVHEFRNGIKVHDRMYPNISTGLSKELEKAGYRFINDIRTHIRGEKVVGHAPCKRPYFDNLNFSTSKATSGPWKGQKVAVLHA